MDGSGGTLCVAAPFVGSKVVGSGGSAKPTVDCSGTWDYDLNALFNAKPGPQAGDTVYCQWIGRDPGFSAPDNYALSSAAQVTLVP